MTHFSERYLKTGGDPRTLPDYAALCDELAKLSHAARPDVNWRYVEKLCLSLFEQNGVELQTAAWYTLARMHLARLFGLNEGLSILEALVSRQWSTLWPQPVHARMEILSGLSQRLQQMMRTISLNYSDLSQLYLAEQQITRLDTVLQRLELKHLSQLDTLRILMHNSAARLENSNGVSGPGAVIQSATLINCAETFTDAQSGNHAIESIEPLNAVKWVYVAQPEYQPNVEVLSAIPVPAKLWKPFTAGIFTMLVAGSFAVWGWQYLHQPEPLRSQLAASLAPLPAILSPANLDMLRRQSPAPEAFIADTQRQLTRLNQLPLDWALNYSRQLVQQAQVLWPDQAKPLVQHWQQQLNAIVLPVESLNGWHQGMTKLQQLADKLNALDEKRGQYMTVSELKSAVFNMVTHFRQTIPAEEQLRSIHLQQRDSPDRQQQIQQTEQHLRAQAYVLMQEKERNMAEK